jgi:hypothetical protein
MCSTIESDSQSGSTQFSVVGGQSVITDTANRNGINTGCISITIAVVVCETTIACCPDIDVPLTFASLEKNKHFDRYTFVVSPISQLVSKMCSQQACSNLVNKL